MRKQTNPDTTLADLESFIANTALVLDIDPPELMIDNEELLDRDVKAGVFRGIPCTPIIVNKATLDNITNKTKKIEFFLIIAHELRHIWQDNSDDVKYHCDEYHTENLNVYENQPEEIDANAFAYLIIEVYFGKRPVKGTWCTYSYDAVMNRVDEIKDDFFARMDLLFG